MDVWPSLLLGDRIKIAAIARKGNGLIAAGGAVTNAARRAQASPDAIGYPPAGGGSGDAGSDLVDLHVSPQPQEVTQHPERRGGVGIEYWACPMCLRKLPALGMIFCSAFCMGEWDEPTTEPVLQVIPPMKTLTDLNSLYWKQSVENREE